jgi:uncharacterized protein
VIVVKGGRPFTLQILMLKRITFFICFLFFTQLSFAQGIIGLINKSEEFFVLLDEGKFEDANAMCDTAIKEKLSAEVLKTFWGRVTSSLGKYQSVEGAQNRAQGDYYLVTLNCKFERSEQAFQFAYNKAEKLVGFTIVPKSTAPQYMKPAYADTSLYRERFVTLESAGHSLAAVVTEPKTGSNFPVVVFVHGSGPSDMDETIGPNKPFKDLATGLASKGIASLRYVKRTMVYAGEFNKAFTVKEEVMDDATAAIALAMSLPNVNKQQVYLFGHSLGGMLAPRIAATSPALKGIILAAAPSRKLPVMVDEQYNYLFKQGVDTSAAAKAQLREALAQVARARITQLGAMKADSVVMGVPASYWVDLNNYDQVATAKKFKGRVLVIQGGFDYQVSVKDFDAWKAALAANPQASFKFYARINHLMSQQSAKGTAEQYALMVNVADYVVNDLAAWIQAGK